MSYIKSGDTPELDEYRIVVIGKTGNGKSSVCNAILGREEFKTGRSMESTTVKVQHATAEKNGKVVKVVDTPDIANMLDEMSSQQKEEEISKWKRLASPFHRAILLAVRCDVRYTGEEYDIYRQIKFYWGDKEFCKRLVVVFTFADRQDRPLGEELKTVCPELRSVLKDAGHRYVVFNKNDEHNKEKLWTSLLGYVTEMDKPTDNPPDDLDPLPLEKILVVALIALLILLFGSCVVCIILNLTEPAIALGVVGCFDAVVLAGCMYSKRGTDKSLL
nr:hypothetical protein BaRGS_034116 [Batillaria attramentaria]